MLENQRRVQDQLAAIEALRGGPVLPPSGGQPPQPTDPADPSQPVPPGIPNTGDPTAAGAAPTQTAGTAPAATPEEPKEPEKSLEELLAELDDLIGLDSVKREIHQQVALLKVEKRRAEAGLKSATITRHLVFVGNPGTGKTTVARMVAGIYRALGLLSKGHLVEVDRSELVAGYLGQTAIKTSEVAAKALGGVLFIDEAYGLNGDQYGLEAVNTLVKEMEDNRNDLVVIVAGYPTPMMEFIAQNPGLASRFKTIIEFADYTDDELLAIIRSLAGKADYDITDDAVATIREILAATARNFTFGNGRFVRNLLEEAIGRHAWRLRDADEVSTEDLRRLLPADFRPADESDGAAGEGADVIPEVARQEAAEQAEAEQEMTAEGRTAAARGREGGRGMTQIATAPAMIPTPGTGGPQSSPQRAAQRRELARHFFTGTPGRMRIAAAIASALCLAFGLAGFLGLRGVDGSTERAKANTEQVVRVRTIYADLLAADAAVTNGFLLGGQESAQNRQTYDEAMARVASNIATAASAQKADGKALAQAQRRSPGLCHQCRPRAHLQPGRQTRWCAIPSHCRLGVAGDRSAHRRCHRQCQREARR